MRLWGSTGVLWEDSEDALLGLSFLMMSSISSCDLQAVIIPIWWNASAALRQASLEWSGPDWVEGHTANLAPTPQYTKIRTVATLYILHQ